MLSASEAAERWGVTPRYVQMACKDGLIPGAVKWGRAWMVPGDAKRPSSQEKEQAETADLQKNMPLPRKTLFLDMTNLYHTPGCAADAIEGLAYNPEAQILFEAEICYARGEIDRVYEKASYLLEKHSGFYAILASGILLGFCAMWRGDMKLWEDAKKHICEAPIQKDGDRDIVSLALTALSSSVYDLQDFPVWFERGIFEVLHPESLPAVKVFYAKYLYAAGYAVASKQFKLEGVEGLSLMTMLPNTIEPMVAQAMADKTVVVEIYLRMICAEIYHNSGNNRDAIRHIDKAIKLAIPDQLFGILVEHRRALDTLLDERIAQCCPEYLPRFRELYRTFSTGWAALSGTIRHRNISTNLTAREREVAKLAAFGLSNAEIAAALNISVPAVKQAIRLAGTKGRVEKRDELYKIL